MASDRFEEIVQDFEFLEDWQDRYGYVIDLGRNMPGLDNTLKVPATKVTGCASQVWLMPEIDQSNDKRTFSFRGDSDAIIVRGLIEVLRALYNGTALASVPGIDTHSELQRLGLEEHLSAQRSNGLRSMVRRIREMALERLDEGTMPDVVNGAAGQS